MVSLEKSEKFQNEYNEYRKKIDALDNMRVKAELEGLLEKLIAEIRNIDRQHQLLVNRNTLADITADSKHKVVDIRRKIAKLLEDYDRAKVK